MRLGKFLKICERDWFFVDYINFYKLYNLLEGIMGKRYGGLSRRKILNLKMGEVVRYSEGYLIVSAVDIERGVVTGELMNRVYGVNDLPIETLENLGIEVTKWQKR